MELRRVWVFIENWQFTGKMIRYHRYMQGYML